MNEDEKKKFMEEFGEDYGYPNSHKNIDEIRATEFKRLQGTVYLDHAGATLYSELQMEYVLKDLTSNVYGNPHSQSDSGLATSEIVRAARQQVLEYCNASPKEYKCIFTSGATGALKLVGEAFPWSEDSSFMYTMENHNSVLGIREYALNKGGTAFAVDIEALENCNEPPRSNKSSIRVTQHPVQRRSVTKISEEKSKASSLDTFYNLFAFPSECNFSGLKFSLDLVKFVKEDSERALEGLSHYSRGHWLVLIDAAKGCATQPPDLTLFPADFVAISFYKIFGYPTGLGALLVRNEAAQLLRKTYFSGGTVAASIADIDLFRRRESIVESFEDGTQSFLNIAAIHHGFKIINTLTISAIARHTTSLATYVRNALVAMRHENGAVVCILYGGDTAKVSSSDFGPTIAFNLKRPDGTWFGYREVEKLASLSGIQLRTGCFCNPGACAKHLGLSHLDLLSNIEEGHVCWDDHDILRGKPTGAVRISFGYMSTFDDAKLLPSFTSKYQIGIRFSDFLVNIMANQRRGRQPTISTRVNRLEDVIEEMMRQHLPNLQKTSIVVVEGAAKGVPTPFPTHESEQATDSDTSQVPDLAGRHHHHAPSRRESTISMHQTPPFAGNLNGDSQFSKPRVEEGLDVATPSSHVRRHRQPPCEGSIDDLHQQRVPIIGCTIFFLQILIIRSNCKIMLFATQINNVVKLHVVDIVKIMTCFQKEIFLKTICLTSGIMDKRGGGCHGRNQQNFRRH